jgi:serine protease Do
MTRKIKWAALMLGTVSIIGGAALFARTHKYNISIIEDTSTVPAVRSSYKGTLPNPTVDFEKAATTAVPSVVHIKTVTKFKNVNGNTPQQNPFGDMFGDDFFKKYFGENGRQFQQPDQRASGSGVIISSDGYIVTNNHVVDGANEINVTLNNRKNYKAKLIGTDPPIQIPIWH